MIGLTSARTEIPGLERDQQRQVVETLMSEIGSAALGDTALVGWAASLAGVAANTVWTRLVSLKPAETVQPTVEVAWALAALSIAAPDHTGLRRNLADRLMAAYHPDAQLFPHVMGRAGFRDHVACFADQVYPIHALAEFARISGEHRPLAVAAECAARILRPAGKGGPVVVALRRSDRRISKNTRCTPIHQDAMAPMALQALARAGGPSLDEHINRGLQWLEASPNCRAER